MRALTIQIHSPACMARGVHAMGGMSAIIPIKNDEVANTAAMDKVGSGIGVVHEQPFLWHMRVQQVVGWGAWDICPDIGMHALGY